MYRTSTLFHVIGVYTDRKRAEMIKRGILSNQLATEYPYSCQIFESVLYESGEDE